MIYSLVLKEEADRKRRKYETLKIILDISCAANIILRNFHSAIHYHKFLNSQVFTTIKMC